MKRIEDYLNHPKAMPVFRQCNLIAPNGEIKKEAILKMPSEMQELLMYCIEHWGESVIAKYVQLMIPAGRTMPNSPPEERLFKKDQVAHVINPRAMVTVSHLLRMNMDYRNAGRYYFVDEEETEKWQVDLKEDIDLRKQVAQEEEDAKTALSGAMSAMVKGARAKAKKVVELKTYFGVGKDLELYEGIIEEEKEDYIFIGTEKACKDFIKAENKKK